MAPAGSGEAGTMRYGDHVWQAVGLLWLLALAPALAALLLGGTWEQVEGLLRLGTLALTPILFAWLYIPLLLGARIAGWPRRPATGRRYPNYAIVATAFGLGCTPFLVEGVLWALAGPEAMPVQDFCDPAEVFAPGSAAPGGIVIRIGQDPPLACQLDLSTIGNAMLGGGLLFAAVLLPALFLVRLLARDWPVWLALWGLGGLAAACLLLAFPDGSGNVAGSLLWLPPALAVAALPAAFALLEVGGRRFGRPPRDPDPVRRDRRLLAGLIGFGVAAAMLALALDSGGDPLARLPASCPMPYCGPGLPMLSGRALMFGLPLGGLLALPVALRLRRLRNRRPGG